MPDLSNHFGYHVIYCKFCGISLSPFALTMTNVFTSGHVFCDMECFSKWENDKP